MKKILYFLIIISITSCQTQMYNTKHQRKTMQNFAKKRSDNHVGGKKRGDFNHPAVTKDTRKSLY